jgi:hypothetical protein
MALKGVRKSHGSRTQRSSRRGECSPRRKSGTGKSSLINVGACLYAPAVGHLILAAFSALLRRVGSNIRRAELLLPDKKVIIGSGRSSTEARVTNFGAKVRRAESPAIRAETVSVN